MAQYLPPVERKPSSGARLSAGVGKALDIGSQLMQEHQQKQQRQQAVHKLGINPAVLDLPEVAQAEYFKNVFAQEKGMTPLQQSQKALADERLKALQGQQELFGQLFQGGQRQDQGQPQMGIQEQEGMPQGQTGIEGQFDLSKLPEENLRQLAAFKSSPGDEGVIGNIAQSEIDKRKETAAARTKKEEQYFKFNEPKLAELSDTQRKLETENARYERLENLFADPSKFPSSFTAALFTKDGTINDIVYSQMTPEAQEAVKLIIDSTSNIKDTYGARITNFDLQTYLKKLPSLLNSPEGKTRVLRDLKIINELNRMHASGIQEIFEEQGGSDKIPYSKAETLYKKRYGGLEKDLLSKFVNPEKGSFKSMPNANEYLGRKIKDDKTGEIFISDGKEWKPFKG